MGNLLSCLFLWVDGHGQTEHILHGIDLLSVLRIPDSGNGMQLWIEAVRRGTGQQVDFVRVRRGNQQIRLLHTRLQKGIHGSTVSGDRHHIVLLLRLLQHTGIGINQRNIVTFRGKQSCQRRSHFSVACNDNIHSDPRISTFRAIIALQDIKDNHFFQKNRKARRIYAAGFPVWKEER